MAIVTLSGNSNYALDVGAALVSQDFRRKTSLIYWRVFIHKFAGTGYMATVNNGNILHAAGGAYGSPRDLYNNRNWSYDFRNGQEKGSFLLIDGTFEVQHRPDGTAEYGVFGDVTLINLGHASVNTGWISLPRLARVPDAPSSLWLDNFASDSIQYVFVGMYDGGSPVREYQVEWKADYEPSKFNWAAGRFKAWNLRPATWYSFRARARNDAGWSPWSGWLRGRTHSGVRLKVDGVWREAVPYVKHGNRWKQAVVFAKSGGQWRRGT